MAKFRPWSWAVVGLLAVVVLTGWNVKMGDAAGVSAAQCEEEKRLGINACKPILFGTPPTAECCQRIRVSHVECVCPLITPKIAPLVDVKRFVRIIQGCGRKVPRNYKCGSITSPP
ncbi:uncharacterized protein LOC124941177 [Impatiens glandulifera]|uniref:uncharacterized protein LOC124941177 n=1 Tax=Impatiens glandulifera TaxID=253017 RepID=UPI001FB09940|nr:uncharacterized protein LOC124941177 [Impatiens glandulifera]